MTKERVRAVINSKDRLNPLTETTSDFTFSFNRNNSRITEIILESIQIPFSFYVINSSNNVITFNSGAIVATIAPGNYNSSSLSLELKNKINTAFGDTNTTVTYSSSTFKLTITRTTSFVIDSFVTIPASTLSKTIGFRISSVSGTTAIGDTAINISGPNYLLIYSKFLARPIFRKTLYVNDNYQDVLIAVPVNTSQGNIITMNPNIPIRLSYKFNISSSDIIDIQIRDENENIINLNGLDIALQLVFVTE